MKMNGEWKGEEAYEYFSGADACALAAAERVAGDVDESGTVDIADVMYLLKCVAGVTGVKPV